MKNLPSSQLRAFTVNRPGSNHSSENLRSIHHSSTIGVISASKAPIEKEGYLYKKSESPSGPGSNQWSRRYFVLKEGHLHYGFNYSNGKYRGSVIATQPINVLLCGVRPDKKEDRRFCFEIYTARKVYVVQGRI
jgi:hypothetical protein